MELDAVNVLKKSKFGHRTAEEEREQLKNYFVETEHWRRVFDGEIDIVYGPKGSGKSAIYSLILNEETALFDRNILLSAAENPTGAPAFQIVNEKPPKDEFEFLSLWKIYFLTLCGRTISEYGITGNKCKKLIEILQDADLLPAEFSLVKALKFSLDYIKKSIDRLKSIEGGITFDPNTMIPNGFNGKIFLSEPNAQEAKFGAVSLDELLNLANDALEESKQTIWILLDRLDVAFADKGELEALALRALFKFYLDTKNLKNIKTKIFLRTDIWESITKEGFREASHIERSITIDWREGELLNLIIRRLISNEAICAYYNVEREKILSNAEDQGKFFYRVFPEKVDSGSRKPDSFSWMMSRTKDASNTAAPREIIHFLTELRSEQIKRLELGQNGLQEGRIFEPIAFKLALPRVSTVRLEQTLFAEYPRFKTYIEAMTQQKATQTIASLSALWQKSENDAAELATALEHVGFFEKTGSKEQPTWRVPFLYRPALKLLQGSADGWDE